MYQLKIGSIPLPKLYVCTSEEANKCRQLGVPYLINNDYDDDTLIKMILFKTLKDKFPHLKWNKILGRVFYQSDLNNLRVFKPQETFVESDIRSNDGNYMPYDTSANLDIVSDEFKYREVSGGRSPEESVDFDKVEYKSEKLKEYIGDIGYYVNIEELQALKLLPVFLDDIASAIKINLMNTSYMDGYNKKLECNLGSWQGSEQAPNLIILDTSGSIPSGIAATMITLIDTLRHQANADLIITSGLTEYFPANTELPEPDKLGYLIGGCNECIQFYAILRKHILGKHWGNVIVFGDNDSPLRRDIQEDLEVNGGKKLKDSELQSTRIDNILAYHTKYRTVPGYGLWARDADPHASITYNTDWVDYMERW